jgi:hypothetical protein
MSTAMRVSSETDRWENDGSPRTALALPVRMSKPSPAGGDIGTTRTMPSMIFSPSALSRWPRGPGSRSASISSWSATSTFLPQKPRMIFGHSSNSAASGSKSMPRAFAHSASWRTSSVGPSRFAPPPAAGALGGRNIPAITLGRYEPGLPLTASMTKGTPARSPTDRTRSARWSASVRRTTSTSMGATRGFIDSQAQRQASRSVSRNDSLLPKRNATWQAWENPALTGW